MDPVHREHERILSLLSCLGLPLRGSVAERYCANVSHQTANAQPRASSAVRRSSTGLGRESSESPAVAPARRAPFFQSSRSLPHRLGRPEPWPLPTPSSEPRPQIDRESTHIPRGRLSSGNATIAHAIL